MILSRLGKSVFRQTLSPLAISVAAVLFPFLAHAQTVRGILQSLFDLIMQFVVPILIGLAISAFFLGIVKFILAAGDPRKLSEAKNYIVWGLVGVFVIAALGGLVFLLMRTFFGAVSSPFGSLPVPY
jgi:hypothetical protein